MPVFLGLFVLLVALIRLLLVQPLLLHFLLGLYSQPLGNLFPVRQLSHSRGQRNVHARNVPRDSLAVGKESRETGAKGGQLRESGVKLLDFLGSQLKFFGKFVVEGGVLIGDDFHLIDLLEVQFFQMFEKPHSVNSIEPESVEEGVARQGVRGLGKRQTAGDGVVDLRLVVLEETEQLIPLLHNLVIELQNLLRAVSGTSLEKFDVLFFALASGLGGVAGVGGLLFEGGLRRVEGQETADLLDVLVASL